MPTQEDGVKQVDRDGSKQRSEVYVLRLYLSGLSPKSLQAIKNVKNICDEHLAGWCELEVVDIYQQPDRAVRDQVVAAPMLVKRLPLPLRRLIGTLSNTSDVLRKLGVIGANIGSANADQEGD